MTRLADLVHFSMISPGGLFIGLERARPDIVAWSRSEVQGALPPQRLSRALLATLPAAFAVHVSELLLAWRYGSSGSTLPEPPICMTNSPTVEILSTTGIPAFRIGFRCDIILSRANAHPQVAPVGLVRSGTMLSWDAELSLFILSKKPLPDFSLLNHNASIVLPASL